MIGTVLTGLELRRDAQTTLQTWVPSILAELANRVGFSFGDGPDVQVRIPQTWTRLPSVGASAEDQYPVVVVTSEGTTELHRDGDGIYQATWRLGVYIAVRGQSFEEVSDLVALQTAAARVAMLQHHSITTPYVRYVRWADESYAELDAGDARSLGAGAVLFDITAGDVVDEYAGPDVPPAAPSYTDPAPITVDTVAETIGRL